ncbi:FAD-dependent oxidoreductase [Dyella sp.]|uniref:FAD-dependent oxidoreductase n=1 Tax=Dyella sp. TaxID=1869338 RepID=UPI002ECFE159
MQRRHFLRHAGATLALASTGALTACVPAGTRSGNRAAPVARLGSGIPELMPVKARPDRITGVYVCTRPFRAAGPRIETERLGDKTVVHNYGHGGSGWSLSWGSSTLALRMAQATGVHELGVIGCGALGLTTALLAQRAGLSVRIYARDLPPNVYSMRASGLWTPDSRICDAAHASVFGDRWEDMARISFTQYQSMLGLPGDPIEWIEGYFLSDDPPGQASQEPSDEPEYAEFVERARFTPRSVELAPGTHPFAQAHVRRYTTLMFNITSYAHMLLNDFLVAGGKIEVREFHQPNDLLQLPERTLVNATGYGARALFGDNSLIPVRGQTARLIPQPEVRYGISSSKVSMVPRRDGLLVQAFGDSGNFNNPDTTPVRAVSEAAVLALARIVEGMRQPA